MQVEGKGTVAINNGHGNVKLLYSVYFIPHLSQNLLSVGQLMASGYSILFDDVSCVIRDKKVDRIIVDVRMTPNKLFPLEVSSVESHALVVKENRVYFVAFTVWAFECKRFEIVESKGNGVWVAQN
ncbi:hypothetical protein Pint_36322 [Pistacia integerrima]|uniref:Uncharacterized protein n=1 Tax=Pistacia integerrima TaxID=434235 RepID=A0ACC0Y6J3_9ROSI|nr:hypothetical protein Pint_36322 [Pistacia integerrima]